MGSLLWLTQFLCFLFFHFHLQACFNCSLPLSSNFSSSKHCCPTHQSLALLQFQKSFSIDSDASDSPHQYPKTESWKEGTDCCSWNGITCDVKTGHVIGLNLASSMLHGTLHPNSTLFSLLHLRKLDLSDNYFNSSSISSQFGQFFDLTHLNLSYSVFSGQVRPEISHLSKLVSLDLSLNYNLALEPVSFNKLAQNLTQLRDLNLNQVNMSLVVPNSLMNLCSSLSSLQLQDCGLQGKFPEISHLSKLVSLDLSYNSNHALEPISFSKLAQNLTQLRELNLNEVNMSLVVPNSLMNLSSSLSSLQLWDCGLQGKFPDSIFGRSNLQSINLHGNTYLTGSFPPFNMSSVLSSLDMSQTRIAIHLDHRFTSKIKSLKTLYISECNFVGSNLAILGNLTLLIELDLSDNNFTGQILNEFANLTHLTGLDLSNNRFDGHIPSFLGNFTQLTWLEFSNNRFGGQIPSSLGNLQKLESLNFSSNNLISEIPNGLGNITQLYFLDLSNNKLIGQIPSSSFALPNHINVINLSHNKLYGRIPPSVFKLENLAALLLSSNDKLTGELSSAICNLKSLEILDLSNNDFSGFIPQCLGNFSNWLSVLHLGANNLHGTIPSTFSKGSNLRYLNFNGNQLKGIIPPSVINCTNLEFLDLGNNKIDDAFPSFLEMLSELKILVLRSNELHGSLKGPTVNDSFSKLHIFDLSNNTLSGPLPTEYFNNFKAMVTVGQNMEYMKAKNSRYFDYSVTLTWKGLEIEFVKIQTALTTLDLSGNRFTGKIPESLGKLESLKELNLSHNRLTGYIQPSLANLTNLESLDISSNLLAGRIPQQLADLTSLEILNLSYNRLEGPVPLGKQFNTFERGSYEGNLALCGFPLQKCNNGEGQQVLPPSNFRKEDDSMFGEEFGWKAVAIGYGWGFAFGVLIGYIVFRTRKPAWFVRMAEGGRHQNAKRLRRKNAPRNSECIIMATLKKREYSSSRLA